MKSRSDLSSCIWIALLSSGCSGDSGATSFGGGVSLTGTDSAGPTGETPTTGITGIIGTDATTGGATLSGGTGVDSSASGDPVGTDAGGDTSTGGPPCADGTLVCDGNTSQVCDGLGGFTDVVVCEGACVEGVGCTLCGPGATKCVGDQVWECNEEGDAEEQVDTCDPLQGIVCDADQGGCAGSCAPANIGQSYIGCDYYPTVLSQGATMKPENVFAVAVSNTADKATTVTVTRGANVVAMATVAANSAQIIALPWVEELWAPFGPSVLLPDGAYRLRSDNPVTVYQYSPLEADVSNDASVLLPTNTWGSSYVVASRQKVYVFPGFYAVVAREDGTKVTVLPSATGKQVLAGGGVAADGTGVVMLDAGDVLQVIGGEADLTGTIVQADRPVQVFGGHKCTTVPIDVAACDHLQESMFPIDTLAKEYLVVPMMQSPNEQLEKAQVIRVIASEDATTLTFSPDQPVGKYLAAAGDFVEIPTTTAKFLVAADKKILVAQYMIGQSGGYGDGDPSMVLAVNPLQWRTNYLVHAPTSWIANYSDLIAKTGAAVKVDGAAVGGWQPIGETGYSYTHVKLDNAGDGNHSVTADQGVGVSVYGIQFSGSYWYPGGLNLDLIPQ